MLDAQEVKEILKRHGISTNAKNLKQFKHGNKTILQLGRYALVLEPNRYKKHLIEKNITDEAGVIEMINAHFGNNKRYEKYKETMLNDYLPVLNKKFINGYYELKEIWQIKGKLGYDFIGILRGYQILFQVS